MQGSFFIGASAIVGNWHALWEQGLETGTLKVADA
jgi:hypothetical protein